MNNECPSNHLGGNSSSALNKGICSFFCGKCTAMRLISTIGETSMLALMALAGDLSSGYDAAVIGRRVATIKLFSRALLVSGAHNVSRPSFFNPSNNTGLLGSCCSMVSRICWQRVPPPCKIFQLNIRSGFKENSFCDYSGRFPQHQFSHPGRTA